MLVRGNRAVPRPGEGGEWIQMLGEVVEPIAGKYWPHSTWQHELMCGCSELHVQFTT